MDDAMDGSGLVKSDPSLGGPSQKLEFYKEKFPLMKIFTQADDKNANISSQGVVA